jgi:hypothetical protein
MRPGDIAVVRFDDDGKWPEHWAKFTFTAVDDHQAVLDYTFQAATGSRILE